MEWLINTVLILYLFWVFHLNRRAVSGPLVGIGIYRDCATTMLTTAIDMPGPVIEKALTAKHIPSTVDDIRQSWRKMLSCMHSVNVYANNYTRKDVSGYVLARAYTGSMWVNAKRWPSESTPNKIRIVLHECSHLALSTEDYYYMGHANFTHLRGTQARNNADTVTLLIMDINNYTC